MHRMKGLEFSRVILAGVQLGTVPSPPPTGLDEISELAHQQKERCLLYVAATRARDELAIVGYGEKSPLLPWKEQES